MHRFLVSSVVSAMIWMPIPLIAPFFGNNLVHFTHEKRVDDFINTILYLFPACIVLAIIMHLFLLKRTIEIKGKAFWLFPFISLPLATSVAFLMFFIWSALYLQNWQTSPFYVLVFNFFYAWGIGLLMCLIFCIWFTYPLAILNQILIKRIYK